MFAKTITLLKKEKIALVFVGKTGVESTRIKKIAQGLGIQDKIVFTGFISEKDLVLAFQSAELLLFPSIYEGFGLPPLEAMACGCPIISSDKSSLPEVVGKGGILLDPTNVSSWVNQIKKILYISDFRNKLIRTGLKQAKKFSWRKCAKETIDVYKEVSKN